MNTKKRSLPNNHLAVEEAYREAYHAVTADDLPEGAILTPFNVDVLRYMMKNFELSDDPLPEGLGKRVRIRERDRSWSTFVCVADNKWYCDGRPIGGRFLNNSQIKAYPWVEL